MHLRIYIFSVFLLVAINSKADNTTIVVNPYNGQPASSVIYSDQVDCNTPVDIFSFDISDGGTDDLATIITNIRIIPASTNTASWINNIQYIKINNGSGYVVVEDVIIEDTYIDIQINANNLTIGDGHTGTITLGICLNTTGLEDGTILSFKIDALNHNFTADPSGSQFAETFSADIVSNDFTISVLCQEPISNSYNITASNLLQNSVDLNWTQGDGENRLVLLKEGIDVDDFPVDNTNYYADASYGLGDEIGTGNYVVYNGHSNSVKVLGLKENKNYYFKIYEFNCNSGNENYLISGNIGNINILTPTKIDLIDLAYKIYPNPSNGNFKIITNNENNKKAFIYTLTGKIILNINLNQEKTTVNMNNYPKGIYFIKIQTKNYSITKKITID